MTTLTNDYSPGLRGIIAAQTHLSSVNGDIGELIIAGYPLEEIAPNATFEQMVYLLWHDRLPDAGELATFRADLASRRALVPATMDVLRAAAEKALPTMDALRMAASTLSLTTDEDDDMDAAMTLIATFPTIVTAYHRLLNGDEPIAPREDLRHASNMLHMLTGNVPDEAHARALETYLNTVVDHGLNASTFTARVVVSTRSDIISAIIGALGALKGPLHGGAPGPALDMVFEIGTPDNAEPYIRDLLAKGERLMGFGHRVYRVRDPRADVLNSAAQAFFGNGNDRALYDLVRHVEEVALRLLEEHKPGRKLQTNVEFYTALILHGIGLPSSLFSPAFACGRVAGWTAHCFEQREDSNIIRPSSTYTGSRDRRWS